MIADAVVVGAGIAGVSAAHRLTVQHGLSTVLVDPRPPLTLTSDKSTECYRNWWPSEPMVGLMNRSIDLLEEMANASGNVFGLSRRGYLFLTARPETRDQWIAQAEVISGYGGGDVRIHEDPSGYKAASPSGYEGEPDGIDILLGSESVLRHFPYLTPHAIAALHVRRAGWFSAQQLGAWMLEEAKRAGLRHVTDSVVAIEAPGDRIGGVRLESGETIGTGVVVDAAGPNAGEVAALARVELPLRSEVHLKVAYRDHKGVVPRSAPMLIWSDPQHLDWGTEERAALADSGRHDLLGEMPVFCHGRPEGGAESPYFLALWEYHGEVTEPVWPVPEDDLYPEVVARGLTTMIPSFSGYLDGLPRSSVDGGYYTKTPENRPLLGPAGPEGFHLACAYSGFGVMAAAGGADLLARHVVGAELPGYHAAFLLSRYEDRGYVAAISGAVESGQL